VFGFSFVQPVLQKFKKNKHYALEKQRHQLEIFSKLQKKLQVE